MSRRAFLVTLGTAAAAAILGFVVGVAAVLGWQHQSHLATAKPRSEVERLADKARQAGLPVHSVESHQSYQQVYLCAWEKPDPASFPFHLMESSPPKGLAKALLFKSDIDAVKHWTKYGESPGQQYRGRWLFRGDPEYVATLCRLCEEATEAK